MGETWGRFKVTSTWQDFMAEQEKKEHPLLPDQLAAFKTLFSDPNVPASDIAQQVAAPLLADVKEPGDMPSESIVWQTVAYAIMQLTEYNDRLFNFVVAFRKIESPVFSFKEMVGFKQHWTEFIFGHDDILSDPDLEAKRQGWLNINLFSVKLTQLGIPVLDESRRGLGNIRTTLEEAPWENFNWPEIDFMEDEEDPDKPDFLVWKAKALERYDIRILDGYVPSVTVWFRYLGRVIYEKNGPTEEYDWIQTKWTGGKVWSRERFHYWRERLEWISTVTALKRKTRNDALETAKLMEEIEQGSR